MGKYGAVSTLDLSLDGTRLLCGHAKGLVRCDCLELWPSLCVSIIKLLYCTVVFTALYAFDSLEVLHSRVEFCTSCDSNVNRNVSMFKQITC